MELGWGTLHDFGQTLRSAPAEIAEYKFYAENKLRCHRGYKPLLHTCRSGDLPALVKTEAGFGFNQFHVQPFIKQQTNIICIYRNCLSIICFWLHIVLLICDKVLVWGI
jgi:hypothetical protein